MEGIKACPFCGGEAELKESPEWEQFWVWCKKCYCGTQIHLTAAEALKAWQRRVNDAAD